MSTEMINEKTNAYKTMTKITDNGRDNGTLNNEWLIGIDIGYSSVKVMSCNKYGVFPFAAVPFKNNGYLGGQESDYITYSDENGEDWLVGRAAQEEFDDTTSDRATFGRQRYDDPAFIVCARVGLALGLMPNKYGKVDGKKIVIQTGLPPKYKDDADILREVLSGQHKFSIQMGNFDRQEYDFEIKPENVFVTMQPLGSLYSVSINNARTFIPEAKNYLSKNLIVFDPGFGTFDLFYLKSHRIVDDQTFSDLGMKQVFTETANEISKKYHKTVSVSEMQKYLKTGEVTIYDRRRLASRLEPIEQILKEASDKICDKAIEKMVQVYPDIADVDYLIITGGTGEAWKDRIKERLKGLVKLTIIDGNQNADDLSFIYANVRGYYMYRYITIKSGK